MSIERGRDRDRFADMALLIGVFLLGMALRLHGLDSSSLWLDEILTSQRAGLDLPTLLSRLATGEGGGYQVPLSYAVAHFAVACLGLSEFTLRVPSMLAGCLSVLLIYKVGKSLWSTSVGLSGAFLLALNAYHVQYSQEARHYALMVFLALLSLIFLIKALERGGAGLWIGFVICTSLGLYNHYFALLFLPAEILFGASSIVARWLSGRKGAVGRSGTHWPGLPPWAAKQSLAFAASLGAVGVSFLPWIAILQGQFQQQVQSQTVSASALSLGAAIDFFRATLSAHLGSTGFVLLFWIVLSAWGMWLSGSKQRILVGIWLSTPFLFVALVQASHPVHERYVIFALPLLLLVAARGLVGLASLPNRVLEQAMPERGSGRAVILGVAVVLLAALSAAPFRHYPSWQKEDWRGAAEYLLDSMGPTDVIIADGQGYFTGTDATRTRKGLEYYFSLAGRSAPTWEAQSGLADRLDQVDAPGAIAWGVLWHDVDLANVEQVGPDFEVIEFAKVAVVRPLAARGELVKDASGLLEALALLQPGPGGRIDLHLAVAEIYLRQGNQADARHQAELAAAAAQAHQRESGPDPRLANAYKYLGDLLEETADLQEALAMYMQAIEVNARDVGALVAMGNIHTRLNQPRMAIEAYQRAWDAQPTTASEYFLLGEGYLQTGNIEQALLAYKEAVAIEPAYRRAELRVGALGRALQEGILCRLSLNLGSRLALLGYGLDSTTVEPGATVKVTLWWLALVRMDQDYTAFVHLVDPGGGLWSQDDELLGGEGRPTSS